MNNEENTSSIINRATNLKNSINGITEVQDSDITMGVHRMYDLMNGLEDVKATSHMESGE